MPIDLVIFSLSVHVFLLDYGQYASSCLYPIRVILYMIDLINKKNKALMNY